MRQRTLRVFSSLAVASWLIAATFQPALGQATPAEKIKTLDGFKIELVYSVPQNQGSWVSLTHDPKGRLIASDQYGRIYRIDVSKSGEEKPKVEPIEVAIGRAQGLLCAFDSLYVVAHAGGGNCANATLRRSSQARLSSRRYSLSSSSTMRCGVIRASVR